MTNLLDKCKKKSKRKQFEEEEVLESSIFEILENDFQIGDLVWAKLNGYSWWPGFVYGCFLDNWKYVKLISKPGLPTKKQYFIYYFGSHSKYAWVHQTCICRYKGLEEFINSSENQVEQATTEEQMSKELHPLWQEAIKIADDISALSINLRTNALEKILRQLLVGTKYTIPQQEINENDQSSKNQENDVVIVKIHTPIQSSSVSLTTAICHFLDKGIPSLTIYEEIRLVNELINHRLGPLLILTDAQLYFEQYVINTASRNYNYRMMFVQSDYFYDFLLKYPEIILKHRQWFKDYKPTLMPINTDKIYLKKWQLATLLHAHISLEQRFH